MIVFARMKAILLLSFLAAASFARADDSFELLTSQKDVVTATRRVQTRGETPAAVDVITRDEVLASGARNLCDLFRFRAGMDVIDGRNVGGSNRCVASIRGFARDSVTELLVLINGRSTYTPLSGTILWQTLPVQLQDIERIEIVRGPNAALFGSGAGLGVINIITRAPDGSEVTVAATGGSLGADRVEDAAGFQLGPVKTRLSHAHQHQDGYPTVSGGPSNDYLHSEKGSVRVSWQPRPSTQLDLSAAGSFDTVGLPTDGSQSRYQSGYYRLKAAQRFDEDNTAWLSVSRDMQLSEHEPGDVLQLERAWWYNWDIDAGHSFGWAEERMHTTWGGSFRYTGADSSWLFQGKRLQTNRIVRGYVHQTAVLAPTARVVGGVSIESPYYAGTRHADYQAALLLGRPDEHVVRFSYSLAHTNPGLVDTQSNFDAGGGFIHVSGNSGLKSYELANWETGYRGRWLDGKLTTDAAFFYTKIRDHTNLEIDDTVNPVLITHSNSNYLIARGVELEARYAVAGLGGVWANYTEEVVTDRDGHTLYIDTTPKHKANLGGMTSYGPWKLWTAAGWKDGYVADSIQGAAMEPIPAQWRLDARVTYAPTRWLDLFVGGHNLLMARHKEFVDGLLVPRVWEGGARLRF